MKHSILKVESIEGNPETVKALLSFAYAAGEPTTLTSCLNRIMTDKQLTPPQVYHRAELDRQTYNRLIQFSSPKRASKRTILQISIGLLATESEATDLLATCGYAFTAEVEDRAYLFCIRNKLYTMYNVYEAKEILERGAYNGSQKS